LRGDPEHVASLSSAIQRSSPFSHPTPTAERQTKDSLRTSHR